MTSPSSLFLADSFRVRVEGEGSAARAQVRGFDRHLERFRAGVAELTGPSDQAVTWREHELEPFLAAIPARIAGGGEGFPRIELWADVDAAAASEPLRAPLASLRLALALRPLPAVTDELRMVSIARQGIDASPIALPQPVLPQLKGPNITLFSELNHRIGAEALLTDATGHAAEGATTSLVWWHTDGSAGCAASLERVSSVTERLVKGIAKSFGGTIRPELRTPAELTQLEVWAVNALHGIRRVTHIDGHATVAPDQDRLSRYREALDHAWGPLLP